MSVFNTRKDPLLDSIQSHLGSVISIGKDCFEDIKRLPVVQVVVSVPDSGLLVEQHPWATFCLDRKALCTLRRSSRWMRVGDMLELDFRTRVCFDQHGDVELVLTI